MKSKKLLIVCGPTGTGKTNLGVQLAKGFNGELINADSRQVYKGLDILTGKDVDKGSTLVKKNDEFGINNKDVSVGYRLIKSIPIWLVDVVDPQYIFNVSEYRKLAIKVLNNIWLRGKLPVVVGGTGLYIKSLINPLAFIHISPNIILRKLLETKSVDDLIGRLNQIDPNRVLAMNESDRRNPRRLIRSIEIALSDQEKHIQIIPRLDYDFLCIGLQSAKDSLYNKIEERVKKRIDDGALEEARNIVENYDPSLPAVTSTGIAQLKEFFDHKISLVDASEKWKHAEYRYAKRQMTWFTKQKDVHWFDIEEENFENRVEALVRQWYT